MKENIIQKTLLKIKIMIVDIWFKGLHIQVEGTYTEKRYSNDRDVPDDDATFEITSIAMVRDETNVNVIDIYDSLGLLEEIESEVLEQL